MQYFFALLKNNGLLFIYSGWVETGDIVITGLPDRFIILFQSNELYKVFQTDFQVIFGLPILKKSRIEGALKEAITPAFKLFLSLPYDIPLYLRWKSVKMVLPARLPGRALWLIYSHSVGIQLPLTKLFVRQKDTHAIR